MERESARREIRRNWREIMPTITTPAAARANGEESYVCPLCGHGANGDGLTWNPRSKDGNGLKCFGCNFSGDIIDLYQKHSSEGYNDALNTLAGIIGITIDDYQINSEVRKASQTATESRRSARSADEGKSIVKPEESQQNAPQRETANYNRYYHECCERIAEPEAASYLQARGISVETAKAYFIGFDPKADPAQSGHTTPRIIIPTSSGHYVGRSIKPDTPKQYAKLNVKGGTPDIFNRNALYSQGVQEVFVLEGAFDALSVLEAGAAAISLNSTSNRAKLLKILEERRTSATLILCLDNDKAGKAAEEELRQGLNRLNVSYVTADICGGYKDPNEHLQNNRAGFMDAVEEAIRKNSPKPDNVSYYIEKLMQGDISRYGQAINTGFRELDRLSGGLHAGVYCIAAISSLGKTTFSAQLADQIATSGTDVIYFSLEQSKLEIVSKGITRMAAKRNFETKVTSLAIRRGLNTEEVQAAARDYAQAVQDRISVVEGNFSCNITFIGDYIRQYIRRTGKKPVVFVDYLQILQPEQTGNRQQTTKETVDSSMTELKRMSRDQNLVMFLISSVNRGNYLNPIDFESLKESGGIEYTCDAVWGLQLQCLEEELFSKDKHLKEKRERVKEAKASTPRQIELVCLKNRNGISSFSCCFDYYPDRELFREAHQIQFVDDAEEDIEIL